MATQAERTMWTRKDVEIKPETKDENSDQPKITPAATPRVISKPTPS